MILWLKVEVLPYLVYTNLVRASFIAQTTTTNKHSNQT